MKLDIAMKVLLALAAATILSTSFEEDVTLLTEGYCEGAELDFCGGIHPKAAQNLVAAIDDNSLVRIASAGGDARPALFAANRIIERRTHAKIHGICASSCLEVLLPAFNEIEFVQSPLIVSHGNVRMILELLAREGRGVPECYRRYVALHDIVLGSRVNPNLPEVLIEHLGLTSINIDDSNAACPHVSYDQVVDNWLPTSDELRSHYHIEFSGPVAADDLALAQAEIDRYYPAGVRFLVQGEILTSR